jgi:hypothetical protein
MPRTPKMQHCFNSGAELGVYAESDPLDHCGKLECQREMRECLSEEARLGL